MTSRPDRPDPDALLAATARDDGRHGVGRLKIFFGFSPGVGKTYAMLESARRLRASGVDVVAGIVETHGREETARLLEGLEVLPRAEISHRGRVLRELDLDAALARRPGLLLVDELAHTNAPGCRHGKRWQDVLEILASGIDVHTTLNVQHLESLVDLVERGTGIRVAETVPDTVLDRADEIELVDIPPDELIARLREGKIYLPEVATRAADRFFRRPNLLHLRELALVRMARRAGSDSEMGRRASGRPSAGVTERIVVGVGAGEGSARAIRDAARIATGLRAEWVAVTVHDPSAPAWRNGDRDRLERNLLLAEATGGRVARVVGASVAAALLQEARRLDATRVVVGRPGRRTPRWPFRERVLERLVRDAGPIDVIVAGTPEPGEAGPVPAAPTPTAQPRPHPAVVVAVAAAVAAVFAAGFALRPWIDDHDMSIVSLLAVGATSLRFGRAAGILMAVTTAIGIDLLFLRPEFALAVEDTKELLSLVLLLSAGCVVAELVVQARSRREAALRAETRLAGLLDLSRRLAESDDPRGIATAVARFVSESTAAAAEVMLSDADGVLHVEGRAGSPERAASASGVVLWCHAFGQPAGRGTATLPGAAVTCLPLREAGRALGVLVIGFDPPRTPGRAENDLLESVCRQASAALASRARGGHPPPVIPAGDRSRWRA